MPFTLSHAAAVLPGVRGDGTGRGRLVPAVLVAGSFAPDMTYYAASVVPGAMEFGSVTHALAGVFTVDVLIAWALAGAWLVLREPLVALLPAAAQGRWAQLVRCGAPRERPSPSVALRWYVSAALGALSHVVWDAFTHHDRWGMRHFPVLGRDLGGAPLYWYLQYGSSAVAAVLIGAFVTTALRRTPGAATPGTATPGVPARGVTGTGVPARGVTGTGVPARGVTGTGVPARGVTEASGAAPGVPVLSVADRWLACGVIGGCAAAGAAQRALSWWVDRGPEAKPWELIPTMCFGGGAGLVLGLGLYAVGARVWRPSPARSAPPAARTEPSRPTYRG
ncbi:DUF4184 family protein [Streptomyces sp. NPDC007084]|uniref:DUF4184 family protein n=1 Tax=Streptomyces sp. NPDC007084 TaxID=3154313 RepID=UPI00345453E2